MTLSETFKEIVKARKSGRKCQVEHPEWTSMDDLVVKSFIPEALRKVYWATKRGTWKDAYVAAAEAMPRLRYAPFMWRLPEQIRVSKGDIAETADMLQMAEDARARWQNGGLL